MKHDSKNEVIKRLKVTSGHLNKIIDMVESDRYCIDVIQQTEAVKGSLKKIEEIILDSHLHTCVVPAIKGKNTEEPIKELLEVFKRR
jgi:DNA-binding FrmR family transcriptional regulator